MFFYVVSVFRFLIMRVCINIYVCACRFYFAVIRFSFCFLFVVFFRVESGRFCVVFRLVFGVGVLIFISFFIFGIKLKV